MNKILFFIIMFFTACIQKQDSSTSLELKQKVPISAVKQESYYASSANLVEEMYTYEEKNNTFNISIDKNGLISFFKPINSSFLTPCGVKVGDTFDKVKRISQKKPKLMPGWGYFILLPDGWFAGLGDNNKILTHGKLSSDSKVIFVFKSVYHLSWYE